MTEQKDFQKLFEAAEIAWGVIANVSQGDWTKQNDEWNEAAVRWRDNYFKLVKEMGGFK